MDKSGEKLLSFVLDLSSGPERREFSLDSLLALPGDRWEVVVAYADSDGRKAADESAALDPRVSSLQVGSGLGVADWEAAAVKCSGSYLCFLRPGDVVFAKMLDGLFDFSDGKACENWLLGDWEGTPYSNWWQRADLSSAPAALLALGVTFPECAAIVSRKHWLGVHQEFPDIRDDATRASIWLALSLRNSPRMVSSRFASCGNLPKQVQADRLFAIVSTLAGADSGFLGNWIRDLSRIGAGLRTGYCGLLDVLSFVERWIGCFDETASSEELWLGASDLLDVLLRRGQRPVWVWGAGTRGREALIWLRERNIPLEGFVDSNRELEGQTIESLHVVHSKRFLRESEKRRSIVIVASMYFDQIASELEKAGFEGKKDFVNFGIQVKHVGSASV